MASFEPINPPTHLTMANIRAVADSLGSLAKSARFAVRITPSAQNPLLGLGYSGILRDLVLLTEAASMPGRGFEAATVRYYGPSVDFPRNAAYEPINLTFLCRSESLERQMFDDWMEIANPTNNFDFAYAKQYRCTIEIFQLAEYYKAGTSNPTAPAATYNWSLIDAWPILLNPQPVTWADTDVQRLTVGFAYRYWTRVGRDPAANSFPLISGANTTIIR